MSMASSQPDLKSSKSRRRFLRLTIAEICVLMFSSSGLTQEAFAETDNLSRYPRPNPKKFQTGDFIWPKPPGKFVPYNSEPQQNYDAAKAEWELSRNSFVVKVKSNPQASVTEKAAAATVEKMEFREFLALYLADEQPGIPGQYSSLSPLYVGHVGIIDKTNSNLSVIEAVSGSVGKVRVISYEDWLKERSDDLVWHGRIRGFGPEERRKIVVEAKNHIEKKYDFWNFDLNDDSGFYCSKLVWMSVYRQLKVPVDGNPSTQRSLWFSPKQLMYSSKIELLHNPGNYSRS